jgi:FkbM family methyltransferase
VQQLRDILKPRRLTHVVDVGANPVGGEPPYREMLGAGLCRVTGFEPQAPALDLLNLGKGPNETYLPDAIGDGTVQTFKVCRHSALSSTLDPDPDALAAFPLFSSDAEVLERISLKTRRLDDVPEAADLDFLKIDIQGGELAVFRNAVERLRPAVVIQTEVSFATLYQGQPTWNLVDGELRRQGFIPFCFASMRQYDVSPVTVNQRHLRGAKQLLEADLVYVRNPLEPERMDAEQLKHLCLIMHHCYRALDLSMQCLTQLCQRGAVAAEGLRQYADLLASGGFLGDAA